MVLYSVFDQKLDHHTVYLPLSDYTGITRQKPSFLLSQMSHGVDCHIIHNLKIPFIEIRENLDHMNSLSPFVVKNR